MANQENPTEVVSFRIDRETLDQFDRLAKNEKRSRGNMIAVLLSKSHDLKKVWIRNLEYLVETINEEEAKSPDSPYVEYLRGKLSATKDGFALFFGEKEKDRVLNAIRKQTGLPIPHVVPLYDDGNRYGLDLDAG